MNEAQSTEPQTNNAQHTEDEIHLLDLLIVLAEHKWAIVGTPIIFGILAALSTLFTPNIYKATARILPPQQTQSATAMLMSQLGGSAGAASSLLGLKGPNDLYIGMLKSRSVADNLVRRFDLQNVYEVKDLESARKQLAGSTTITSGKDGLIVVEVEDVSPQRAAEITNFYVEELGKVNSRLAVTEASRRRIFFERELDAARTKLADAEAALKGALDAKGVVSVDSQIGAVAGTIERLRTQISAKEVEISTMKAFVTPNNAEYKRARHELESMRGQLAKLENGSPSQGGVNGRSEGHEGLVNIKAMRDIKRYQTLYELLAKQYEAARLDESKEASIIQVLDRAIEPERRSKPKRTLIVLLAAGIGFMFAVFYAFTFNAVCKFHRGVDSQRWERLKRAVRLTSR